MEISRLKLLEALTGASAGLATTATIEQSSSIIFTEAGIYTYNDEIAVFYPLDGVDFEGAVNSKELMAFCNKVKGEAVTLTANDGELLLSCGKSKVGLTLVTEIKLPTLKYPKKYKKLPEDFVAGVKYTVGSAGTNFTEAILTNICITPTEVVGTDKYRLSLYKWKGTTEIEGQILIPAHQISKVLRLTPTEFALDDSWIHFRTTTNSLVSCRVFEERFPNYTSLLHFDKDVPLIFPEEIGEVIEKASIFSKMETTAQDSVSICFAKKKVTVSAKNEAGWFKEHCRCADSKTEVSFEISPSSLVKLLQKSNTAYVQDNRIIFAQDNLFYMSILKLNQ